MTNIGIACFNYFGGKNLLFASDTNASWLKETYDIRDLFGELVTFKPNDFVILLSPCSTGMQIIISKMIMSHYGDNLSVYLHLPFGIDIDGETLNSIVEYIISAIKLNSKDGIINCLNAIAEKQFSILDEQEDIEYKTSEKLAYRHLKNDDLPKIFGNVFQSYYYDYKYIFLALDIQTVANVENKQDLTFKPIIPIHKEDVFDNNQESETEPYSQNFPYDHDISSNEDFEEPQYTSEWLKKNVKIRGWLSFFIFLMVLGGIISAIYPIATFNPLDYANNFWLEATDIFTGLSFLGIAIYSAYLFLNCKPNAVFYSRAYVVIVLLSNFLSLITGAVDELGYQSGVKVAGRVIGGLIWLLYLNYSKQVKTVIPVSFRKVSKLDIGIIAGVIIMPFLLFSIGVIQLNYTSDSNSVGYLQTEIRNTELADDERTDGRVVFTIPEGFTCERKDVEADGDVLALFIINNDKIGSCTMCSNYDMDTSDAHFDVYWSSSKEKNAYKYTEYDVDRGT
ncbi:MAG: hypothetical protein LUC88_03050, partial [Prevotella sp.]|nr:hypothetical protein [Prevotella sp.]